MDTRLADFVRDTRAGQQAEEILRWTRDSAWPTGVLAEQVNPKSRQEVSVSPLNWSQAEYVSTLLDTITEK